MPLFTQIPYTLQTLIVTIDSGILLLSTIPYMAGVDQYTLMKLMSHKKREMTNRYIEIADAHQAENLEKAVPTLFPTVEQGAIEAEPQATVETIPASGVKVRKKITA